MDRPRFSDYLEAIKFLCKDFWSELFKKQIDNLKTNHRGTFVLQDNFFRWLSHMSIDASVDTSASIQDPATMAENKAAQAVGMHLYFSCGIIRGALSNLGMQYAVSADISSFPTCTNVNMRFIHQNQFTARISFSIPLQMMRNQVVPHGERSNLES